MIVDVDPDFANLTHYGQDMREKGPILIPSTHTPELTPIDHCSLSHKRCAHSNSNWHALKKVNGKSFPARQEQAILVTMN